MCVCVFQSVVIDDATAHKVQKLLLIVNIVPKFPFFLLGLGVVLFLIGIFLLIHAYQKKVIRRRCFCDKVRERGGKRDRG